MKKLILVFMLMSSPIWAQSKPVGISNNDNCKPIGRTADGKLVYSMKCEYLPIQPTPSPAAATAAPAPVETEVVEVPENKGGLFKFPFGGSSLGVNTTTQQPGVGPAGQR